MSKYVGIQTQQRNNNRKSIVLLVLFPCILIGLTWCAIFAIISLMKQEEYGDSYPTLELTNILFVHTIPFILGGCFIWFLIAYFFNVKMIQAATGAKPLSRKENKRIYNLVENLCIETNMDMPKINVIEDSSLNAFASGINKDTFTVTLTRGIIKELDDEELEGVIAHELSHIRNRDVRLLIISILFVGIFSFLVQMLLHASLHLGSRSSSNEKGNGQVLITLVLLVLSFVAYLIAMLMRFAISRNREYMADAGAAEMTRKPWALASALRKISKNSGLKDVDQKDVAQLFIDNYLQKDVIGLFATHPPIENRIKVLEQF